MRFELTTLCLGSRCSTPELRPRLSAGPSAEPRPGASGAEGIRTPDLLNAIQALSQLSYSPTPELTGNMRPSCQGRGRPVGLEPTTS